MKKYAGFESEVSLMDNLGELNSRTFVGLGDTADPDSRMYEGGSDSAISKARKKMVSILPIKPPSDYEDKYGPLVMVPPQKDGEVSIDFIPILPDTEIPLQPESVPYLDIRGNLVSGGPQTEWWGTAAVQPPLLVSTEQPAVTGTAEADSMGPLDMTAAEGGAIVLPISPRSLRGSGGAGSPLGPSAGGTSGAATTAAKNNAGLMIAAVLAALVLGG